MSLAEPCCKYSIHRSFLREFITFDIDYTYSLLCLNMLQLTVYVLSVTFCVVLTNIAL
jgi:hypothetical protein